jgi:hypothetical protein
MRRVADADRGDCVLSYLYIAHAGGDARAAGLDTALTPLPVNGIGAAACNMLSADSALAVKMEFGLGTASGRLLGF